jgi:predicted metal-dependent hydrolase
MSRSTTPDNLMIVPRQPAFTRARPLSRWWYGGRPHRTALFNSFSATFPKGESFFIQSVRHFRDCASAPMREQIEAFILQEAAHSREHLAFNRWATEAGYDISPLEQRVEGRLSLARQQPPVIALAITMVLEHFTAILSHQVLANAKSMQGVDTETAALWLWHCAEEIEHKGVAFDTWLCATRQWSPSRRWFVRAGVMLRVTGSVIQDRTAGALELLRQDGIIGWRAWLPLLWEMWGSPGIFRKSGGLWMKFFIPGFHPWMTDDRHLIRRYVQ